MPSSSKILKDPSFPGGGSIVEGSFSVNFDDDFNVSSIIEHKTTNPTTGGSEVVLDPTSDKFNKLLKSGTVNTARNVAKYGSTTDSYESLTEGDEVAHLSDEQLQNEFIIQKKKLDNENQNNIEDANDEQNIATSAFAAYGYGGDRRVAPTTEYKDKKIFAYPLDIDTNQDHMKITRYEYFRPATKSENEPSVNAARRAAYFSRKTSGFGGGDLLEDSKIEGAIILPMPKVVDTNGAEWGESKVNVFGLAVGEIAAAAGLGEIGSKKFSKFNAKGAAKQIERDARKSLDKRDDLALGGKKGSFGDGAQLLMASAVTGVANAAGANISQNEFLARTGGRVLNPNAELLFQGPVLRDFNFDFTMIARSREEGDEIRKIIRFLKVGMAPRYQNQVFLRTPKIFKLEYKRGIRHLNTVNRFNPSGLALRTLAVDYAPNGYWSAYQDSQPIALRMSLNFAELKPIYDDDQNDSPEGSVGY